MIRWVIESMSDVNSSKPRELSERSIADRTCRSISDSDISETAASALAEARMRVCASACASADFRSTNPLIDVTATTITSSTATSSSSPSCASRAAAMNSFATEKLMDTDKSEPIFDRAAVVASTVLDMSKLQQQQQHKRQSAQKPPQALIQSLFYSRPGMCASIVFGYEQMERANTHARRIFEAPILTRQLDRYLSCQTFFLSLPTTSSNAVAGKKRRSGSAAAAAAERVLGGTDCAGCVFGCALGNVVNYCSHAGSSIPAIVRKIHEVLVPVAAAVLSESGKDAHTLCAGIAAHRIARSQQLRMGNEIQKGIHCRQANPSIVLGLVASIYSVFAILSSSNVTVPAASRATDVEWFVKNGILSQSLSVAEYILRSSTPQRRQTGFSQVPEFEIGADEAELRAVQRAIEGVATASRMASQNVLDAQTTFCMQLSFLSKSAWPTNERIGPDTQNALINRIKSPIFFTLQHSSQGGPVSHPGLIVPLSQLSGIEHRASGSMHTDTSSVNTRSSRFSGSNPSSNGSSNKDSEELDIGPFIGSLSLDVN